MSQYDKLVAAAELLGIVCAEYTTAFESARSVIPEHDKAEYDKAFVQYATGIAAMATALGEVEKGLTMAAKVVARRHEHLSEAPLTKDEEEMADRIVYDSVRKPKKEAN